MSTEQTPAEQAITRVLHALAAAQHESLCNCRAYPDGCTARSRYDQDHMLANLTYAEPALEEAIRQGWTPPVVAADTDTIDRIRCAISDPGSVTPRKQIHDGWPGTTYESVSSWSARAVLESVAPLVSEVETLRAQRDAAITEASKDRGVVAVLRSELAKANAENARLRAASPPASPPAGSDAPDPARTWQSAAEVPRYLGIPLRAVDGTTYSRMFVDHEYWTRYLPDGSNGGHHRLVDLPADAWPLTEVVAAEVPAPTGTEHR